MAVARTRVGHFIARSIGFDVNYRDETTDNNTGRAHVVSIPNITTFVGEEPIVAGWFQEILPARSALDRYLKELLLCLGWITRYNPQWLVGDLVAGAFSFILKA